MSSSDEIKSENESDINNAIDEDWLDKFSVSSSEYEANSDICSDSESVRENDFNLRNRTIEIDKTVQNGPKKRLRHDKNSSVSPIIFVVLPISNGEK